jgi:hypothetical protein
MVFGNIFQAQKDLDLCMQEIQKEMIVSDILDQLQEEEASVRK